jgi:hypothetical protein
VRREGARPRAQFQLSTRSSALSLSPPPSLLSRLPTHSSNLSPILCILHPCLLSSWLRKVSSL